MKIHKKLKDKLRTWIELDRRAIKNNFKIFKKISNGKTIMGIVKSNAYGHGIIQFSKELEKLGIDWLGVDSIVEANTLRRNKIKKPILVLGYTLPKRMIEASMGNISLTISDFESLKQVINLKRKINIHLKIDTGMNRQGFLPEDVNRVINLLKNQNNVFLGGVYTHFSSAKNPNNLLETRRQLKLFSETCEVFRKAGFDNIIKHAEATGGSMILNNDDLDLFRIGIGLYGVWPSDEMELFYKDKIKLKPVLIWKSIVSQIKVTKQDGFVGYDQTEKIKKGTKIAVIPVGYWHGFIRDLSSRGRVLVKGQFAKVLGRVSMDMIVVDITNIKNIKVGDVVLIIGKSGRNSLKVKDLVPSEHTSTYEVITRLNPLIERVVV